MLQLFDLEPLLLAWVIQPEREEEALKPVLIEKVGQMLRTSP